jgi:hypothetical protein
MTTEETKLPAQKAAAKSPAPARKVAPRKPATPAVKTPAAKKVAKAVETVNTVVKPAAVKPIKPAKPVKVVRDSFTMPDADFAIIDRIKLRAIEWKQPVKKSEVLRAALHALDALSDAKVKALLADLVPIKKGRPKAP